MSSNEAGPNGELALQTLATPKGTNADGDIFGRWLVSQMDLAAVSRAKWLHEVVR
jgi:acyl-CoA thioesterase YciA|tara:strand:- start:461 stop:625 length:165 start_codon:yes stop_codon:yes gene_type:complete